MKEKDKEETPKPLENPTIPDVSTLDDSEGPTPPNGPKNPPGTGG